MGVVGLTIFLIVSVTTSTLSLAQHGSDELATTREVFHRDYTKPFACLNHQ
jgi:hypothetical protein